MSFTPPTTLPSIQFLLPQQTSEDRKFTKGHRSTRSVSSLPSELQNLSLNGPSLQGTSPSKDDSQIPKAQPSWMTGPPPSSATTSTSSLAYNSPPSTHYPPSIAHHHHHHHQHQRSLSDLSMTTPSVSSTNQPALFQPSHGFNHHSTTPQTSIAYDNSSSLSPLQNHNHRQRHLSHRRAISATTVDHIMQPSSTPPPVPPPLLPFYHRAHSNSPPENYRPSSNTNSQPVDAFMDRQNVKLESDLHTTTASPSVPASETTPASAPPPMSTSTPNSLPRHDTSRGQQQSQPAHPVVNGMELPRDITGRYLCPFCQKAFSRPSSLRIHTYSHTKEKPFACPECPRQFSVQSNMRRHLRIHLIRPTNKTSF